MNAHTFNLAFGLLLLGIVWTYDVLGVERKIAWFLCVGSAHETSYMLFLQVALESGLQSSGDALYPIILVGRNPRHIPDWLLAMNRSQTALVVNHNTTFERNIATFARDKKLSVHGAYLRLDIPVLIGRFAKFLPHWGVRLRTDVAFYTDCDVMVLNVNSAVVPDLIAMGPEVHKGKVYNTGVLFMNIAAFSAARPGLLTYANKHQWVFGGCDQGLINEYFREKRTLLPDEYNWKPYWGINDKARVVHFHGPKLGRCIECLVKHRFLPDVNHTSLCGCIPYNKAMMVSRNQYHLSFDQQMQSYMHYMQLFYKFLYDFGERVNRIGLDPRNGASISKGVPDDTHGLRGDLRAGRAAGREGTVQKRKRSGQRSARAKDGSSGVNAHIDPRIPITWEE